MINKILLYLCGDPGVLNLFKYITFRTMGAIISSLIFSFMLGKPLIRFLKNRQKHGQPIRELGPETHLLTKKGTPTMGGVLIIGAIIFTTLLWADINNGYVWIILIVTVSYGILGAVDDYVKLTKMNHKGLSGKVKLLVQFTFALLAIYINNDLSEPALKNCLFFPFIKDFYVDMGWLFYVFGAVVIVGSSNAVNLTDGLDGLAIVPAMITAVCFCIISYLVGNSIFAHYLQINYVPNVGEVCVLLGSLIGAALGFLWYNAPPAKVFMGDTGSLAIGGALGTVAVITKHEIVLAVIGGLFVLEAVSVILQVGYYKITKKRIFLMAPIHHHFEKKGWAESTVVIRFWIISFILAIIGLATLKIR